MSASIPVFGERPKAVPTPKLRALVSFPGNIVATTGISVEKVSGTYTFETNWNDFGSISAIPTAPTSYILTFDTATQAYVLVPSHLLGGAVAGIADAPNDGTQYGRQSGAWTAVTSGGFADAPSDGTQYGRQSGAWTSISSSMPATVAPLVDGVAQVGTSLKYAREDHKHPSDPTRLTDAPTSGSIYGRQSGNWVVVPSGGTGIGDMLKSTYDPTVKNADAFDSNNESFLQAGTGAVTRRSRDKMRDWVSVKDFGATGDGVTNDTNAINLAMAAANLIYFPTGNYKTTAALTVASKSIRLFGSGPGNARILCAHSGNGLSLLLDNSASTNIRIEIIDLDIVNVSGGASNAAISVVGTAVIAHWAAECQLLIENIRVCSSDYSSATEKWNYGIYLQNISNPRIVNVDLIQIANHTGTAIRVENGNWDGSFVTFGMFIESPEINGWSNGIAITGSIEGVEISKPGMLVNDTAIYVDGTNSAAGFGNVLQIVNGNIAANGAVIVINKTNNVLVQGVDLFRYGSAAPEANVLDIQNSTTIQIIGNKIGTSATMPDNNMLGLNANHGIVVSANNFHSDGTSGAIAMTSNVGGVISGNFFMTAGGGPQAWYAVFNDRLMITGNVDTGFGNQSNEFGNTNHTNNNNAHY